RAWRAASGAPPVAHVAHTYRATLPLPEPVRAAALEFSPVHPAAYTRIDRVTLIGPDGERVPLSAVSDEPDHTLAYRSREVAVFENHGARPRASLVHAARLAANDAEALQLLTAADFRPDREAVLDGGTAPRLVQPADLASEPIEWLSETGTERRLRVRTAADGLLVLADADYPGWTAEVDGIPAELRRANLLFQ